MRRNLALLIAAACLAAGFAFLLWFEENLHCSQWTSFRIAVFDMVPHDEEVADGREGLPAYSHPTAIPIRTGMATLILAILLWPGLSLIAVVLGRLSRIRAFTSAVGIWLAAILVAATSRIVGERLQALLDFSLAAAVLILSLSTAGLWVADADPRRI